MDSVLSHLSTTAIGILALTIITFCLLFLFHSSRVGQVREPPMAAGAWPILGHLPLLSGSQPLHLTLGAMADKYGPLFTIKFGATKTLVLSNWEMAKECFTTNDMVVSSRPKSVAIENLTYNQAMFGFAPYGPYWRELRKIVASEFLSNHHIELLGHICVSEVQASIKELLSVWSSTKNEFGYVLVDMKQWFAQLAYNMVLRMVAGERCFDDLDVDNEDKAQRFNKTIREFMRQVMVFTVGDAIPSLRWLDLGGHEKAMKKTRNELDKILSEWLEEHHQKTGLEEKASSDHRDFMDVMLSVLNEKKVDGFDADTIIKATALTLIVGGADPPGITLTWAMCLLLRNPHALEKAKEELDIQIGRERCISESDINKLVYLQAVVKETLRLHSPGPLAAPREFTENCTLGGYHVEKGTRLITNLQKIQTDASIWPEPLEFKPERYLTTHKDVDVRGYHFELLPFGSGRRICPGMSFGLQMVHLTLANFLHSFEILNPSTEPVDMTGALGLTIAKATPLEILAKPRLASTCYETI